MPSESKGTYDDLVMRPRLDATSPMFLDTDGRWNMRNPEPKALAPDLAELERGARQELAVLPLTTHRWWVEKLLALIAALRQAEEKLADYEVQWAAREVNVAIEMRELRAEHERVVDSNERLLAEGVEQMNRERQLRADLAAAQARVAELEQATSVEPDR